MKKIVIYGIILCLTAGAAFAGGKSEKSGETVVFQHPNSPKLSPGDRVFVNGGDFQSSKGTVTEIKLDNSAYAVLLDSGRNVLIRKNLLVKIEEVPPPPVVKEAPPAPVVKEAEPVPVVKETPPAPVSEPVAEENPPPVMGTPPPLAEKKPVPVIEKAPSHTVREVKFGTPVPEPQPVNNEPPRLAILPVVGVEGYTAETLAWHIANQSMIYNNFKIVPITPNIRKNVLIEQSYDAFFHAGEDVHAEYILASFIRELGYQKVFFTVVLDVETRQQIAGAYKIYCDIEEIQNFLPQMAKKIMQVVQNSKPSAPKLSVKVMAVPECGINLSDAVVLSQLLAIEMANTNMYRVFPRTDSIDAAVYEYETQRTSSKKVYVTKEELVPADFVLSSKISVFESKNEMLAEILSLKNDVLFSGTHINFDLIDELPGIIPRLAKQLVAKSARSSKS